MRKTNPIRAVERFPGLRCARPRGVAQGDVRPEPSRRSARCGDVPKCAGMCLNVPECAVATKCAKRTHFGSNGAQPIAGSGAMIVLSRQIRRDLADPARAGSYLEEKRRARSTALTATSP